MKLRKLCLGILMGLMYTSAAMAQGSLGGKTVGQVLDARITGVEKEFISAVDAMPEDKFSFVPSGGEFKGVRTFAQQVKHVAAVNYMFGAAILGEKPPVDTGEESGPASVQSKADIMKFTKDSFTYLHKAMNSITEKNMLEPMKNPFGGKDPVNRLGIAVLTAQHPFDHYGQMVVYLRLNGIVPPASR